MTEIYNLKTENWFKQIKEKLQEHPATSEIVININDFNELLLLPDSLAEEFLFSLEKYREKMKKGIFGSIFEKILKVSKEVAEGEYWLCDGNNTLYKKVIHK